jgi:ABC-type multidrug transport system permease subunit
MDMEHMFLVGLAVALGVLVAPYVFSLLLIVFLSIFVVVATAIAAVVKFVSK